MGGTTLLTVRDISLGDGHGPSIKGTAHKGEAFGDMSFGAVHRNKKPTQPTSTRTTDREHRLTFAVPRGGAAGVAQANRSGRASKRLEAVFGHFTDDG